MPATKTAVEIVVEKDEGVLTTRRTQFNRAAGESLDMFLARIRTEIIRLTTTYGGPDA